MLQNQNFKARNELGAAGVMGEYILLRFKAKFEHEWICLLHPAQSVPSVLLKSEACLKCIAFTWCLLLLQ